MKEVRSASKENSEALQNSPKDEDNNEEADYQAEPEFHSKLSEQVPEESIEKSVSNKPDAFENLALHEPGFQPA